MKPLYCSALVCCIAFAIPLRAAEAITNVMSSIVSYQFPEDFSKQALTNGGILSPIVSYQYCEWPGNDILKLSSSPQVSYYYQFSGTPILTIVPSSRVPTVAETTPAILFPIPPPSSTQLKTFENGAFTSSPNFPLNKNRITVVLTHGWNSNPTVWASNMAAKIRSEVSPIPNVVAWDWREAAESLLPGKAAGHTKEQGMALGNALITTLGSSYSQPIHFIGHSLGTLVNAEAAEYVQANGVAWQNIHMTLFDEAEVAKASVRQLLLELRSSLDSPRPYYGKPLPNLFAWADNYVSAFGLLHNNAANVILTHGFPSDAPSFNDWWDSLLAFHGYPYSWYEETISTDVTTMGFRWSFEHGGFGGAPMNAVFLQDSPGLSLLETDFSTGTALLKDRVDSYLGTLSTSAIQPINNSMIANDGLSAVLYATGPGAPWSTLIQLFQALPQLPISPGRVSISGSGEETNVSPCVWIPVDIPTNAVSMSCDFLLHGDALADSFAVGINGTNVLSVPVKHIETDILLNSGMIDVRGLAGRRTEIFFGLIGVTTTNLQLTVQDLWFYSSTLPTLRLTVSANASVITWPVWASGFSLETSDSLLGTSAWIPTPSLPVVTNLHNAFTDPLTVSNRFYRLRAQ